MKFHDVRHRFDFECEDDLGCFTTLVYEDRFCTQRQANAQARTDGWSLGKRDFCPEHRRGA